MNSNNPIRILHVLTAMNRAGTETMLMNLYRSIDREKIQFDFAVTADDNCDYDDEIESMGGKIIHYPKYTGKNHFVYKKWWNGFFNNHPEYKIVHGHIGSTASIYLGIAKKYNCFTIAHSHSAGGKMNCRRMLYKIYSFSTRYIADYFFGCSNKALVNRYGVRVAHNNKISSILNNSIDVSKYKYSQTIKDEVRQELEISSSQLVVGTVGRFTDAKNPYFIIEILSSLKEKCPDFIFLWAGAGELKKEIELYIYEKNLQNNVKLLGVRNDIERILQVLNVFILPSKFEGLPVVGVETQAAGVPLLCSKNVAPEIKISKGCKLLPIDSTEPWVEGILHERQFRRIETAVDDVISAGYDSSCAAKELQDFYLSKYQKCKEKYK